MPSRSHLTRPKPRNLTVDLGEGDSVSITYDSNKISPPWLEAAQARDEAQDVYSLAKMLADVMIGWDVTEDSGSSFPPTAENIGTFSFAVQTAILKMLVTAVGNDPPSEEGNASGNTSSTPTGDSSSTPASPQNGPSTSTLPQSLASPSPT